MGIDSELLERHPFFLSDTAKQGNEVRPQNELPRPLGSLGLELNEENFLVEVS